MFPILHPGKKLKFAPYLEYVACVLMRVEEGKYRCVLINLPPRHMKSMLMSVLYPAWRLGRDPTAKFICISYSDDLTHDLSILSRKVVLSDLFKAIFPGLRLDKKAVDYIRTTVGGYRYSVAVGSHITGFGADEIIIDDPLQPSGAASESVKQNFKTWMGSSVLTRFNDPKEGRLILVMHRLSIDDPSTDFEPTADFVIRLPLIAEKKEGPITWNGKIIFRRKAGEPLNPGMMGLEDIAKLRATVPPHVFAAQYQQRPTAGGSGMLSIDKFYRFDLAKPPKFERLVHSWDIGATISGNPSVLTTWGVAKNDAGHDSVYLTNVQRLQLELPDVVEAIKVANKCDKPSLIIVDERGVGLGVYQWLRNDGFIHVTGSIATSEQVELEGLPKLKPNQSKVDRFGMATMQIADGRVFIPMQASWLDSFSNEVAGFPNIPDKDQVDSMTQLVGNMDGAIKLARKYKPGGF